jgi:adenosylcobinamide kinase/adenosylcobinamide-phosphate guanylyltransferase
MSRSVSKQLSLILGGARSGKSRYAEELAAQRGEQILYVATAQAFDAEMEARIAQHRAERPPTWQTLEAPHAVGAAVAALEAAQLETPWDVVLLDCLTLLANNVIAPLPEPVEGAQAEALLRDEVDGLLAAYAASRAGWIVVSNEVGLGIVPAYRLGRVYRDALGRANQALAAAADEVWLMVAGLPLRVK